ncbi:hypothetical protein LC040_15605 [Bacillus tianshenii]|nr:hypothetical protein LC040_15605 [Bacillus tianshenii]
MKALIFALFMTVGVLTGCNETEEAKGVEQVAFTVEVFEDGKLAFVEESDMQLQYEQNVSSLLENAVDRFRLYYDDSKMEKALKSESGIIITYKEPITYKVGIFGDQQVEKIVLFKSGDFAAKEGDNNIAVFTRIDGEWKIWNCEMP